MQNPQYEADAIDHENGNVTPVGVGTPMTIDTLKERQDDGTISIENVLDEETLLWAGSQKATETFYVLVTNTSDAPVSYTLDETDNNLTRFHHPYFHHPYKGET